MSNETKWTPAPWEWSIDRFRDGYSALMSGDEYVIYPQRENDGDDGAAWFGTDEHYYGETALTEANANLIAAAPELYDALAKLEALGGLEPSFDSSSDHKKFCRVAQSAMAKSRGEQ